MRIAGLIVVCIWVVVMPFLSRHDLERLPALYTHFNEHQSEHPALTFSDFLLEHYAVTDHHRHHDESPGHDDLPFDHHHCKYHPSGIDLFVPITSEFKATYTVEVQHFHYLAFHGDDTNRPLLDPPRA